MKKPSAEYYELQSVHTFFGQNFYGDKIDKIKKIIEEERKNAVTSGVVRRWGTIEGRLRLVQEAMVDLLEYANEQSLLHKAVIKKATS